MEGIIDKISIEVNEKVFLRDPLSSKLGHNILQEGAVQIAASGLEDFTFKKLSCAIDSTESSIYRYFENKHKLLIYYINVYWGIMEHMLIVKTHNIECKEEKLKIVVSALLKSTKYHASINHINLLNLHDIFVNESAKSYLTRNVDKENKDGLFVGYNRFCNKVSDFILELNPSYKYPNSIVSVLIDGIMSQTFFIDHLPSLCDIDSNEQCNKLQDFFEQMLLNTITK